MTQKGRIPCVAIPAASVTACCSAMPTSMHWSGKDSIIFTKPLPVGIAGVMATIFLFFRASSRSVVPKTSWYLSVLFF